MKRSIKIPIVYYHSVGPVIKHWYRNFLTISQDDFKRQLKYFRDHYTIISMREAWMIRSGLAEPVSHPLVITFDDGYSDNYTFAFPVLKEFEAKATIFISPLYADNREIVRSPGDVPGFLSWKEMQIMEDSGLVDIQSHTLSHAKYTTSDKIVGFHHPGGDILHPAINLFPGRRTDHIGDPTFEKVLPYGYPLFENGPAMTARIVKINPDFISLCVDKLSDYDFTDYNFNKAMKCVNEIYNWYRTKDRLITAIETEEEYVSRVTDEIYSSKQIIEEKLNKRVDFLCWPHGVNSEMLHALAMEAGYLMTTQGKSLVISGEDHTRIPERLGVDFSSFYNKRKTISKLKALSGEFPNEMMLKLFRGIKRT